MTRLRLTSVVILLSALASGTAHGGQIAVFSREATAPISIYSNDLQNLGYIPGPPAPVAVLSTPSGTKYFVISGSASGTISIATTPLNGTARTVDIGEPAQGGAVTPDGRRLIVLTSSVRIYDTDTEAPVGSPINAGSLPNAVGVSPDSRYAYVLSSGSNTVALIDLSSNSLVASQPAPANATAVSVAPNGRVYVGGEGKVSVYDGRSLTGVATIQINGRGGALSFSIDGRYALCPNLSGNTNSLMELDLAANGQAATLRLTDPDGGLAVLDRIDIVSSSRAIGYSLAAGRMYDISYPVLSGTELNVPGYGIPAAVSGEVASLEFPSVRSVFFVNNSTLSKYDLSAGTSSGLSAIGYPGAVTRLGETPVGTISRFKLDSEGATVPLGSNFLLIARGLDSNGTPVRGAFVTFSSTNAGVSFVTTASPATVGDGFATVVVTAPSVEGAFQIKITSGSVVGTFHLQAGSGAGPCVGCTSASLVKVQGDGQLAITPGGASQELVVKALDANGKPASGVDVTWSTSGSISLAASSITVTDKDGLASMPVFLTAILPSGTPYNSNTVSAATASAIATFSVVGIPFPVGSAAPSIRLLEPEIASTIVAKAGSKLDGAITVAVAANSGVAIPGVGVSVSTGLDPTLGPVATCEGGTVLTDTTGYAACNLIASGQVGGPVPMTVTVGGSYSFPLQLRLTPGDPDSIKIVQGDGQSGVPGALLPLSLAGQVLDGLGNPLPNTAVSWEVIPAGAVSFQLTDQRTDFNGRASTQVRLGSGAGAVQVRLRSGSASATFNLTIVVPVSTLTKVSGDSQAPVIVGQSFPNPLIVQVGNASGQPVAGIAVAWQVTSGSATLSANSTTTDASGRAQVTVTAGNTPGQIIVSATVAPLTPVSFSLTSRAAGPVLETSGFNILYTNQIGLVSGGYTILTGKGLAPNITGVVYANTLSASLPTTLATVRVQIGGDPNNLAPIYAVANVNGVESVAFVTPFETPAGSTSVTVRVGTGSTTVTGVPVVTYAPAIMETADGLNNRVPLVIRSDGRLVTADYPARLGETLTIYVVGLGQTTPQAQTNVLGGLSQPIAAPMAMVFGNAVLSTVPAYLSRQFISVYEINVTVPANADLGAAVPLVLQIAPPNSGGPFFSQGYLTIPIVSQ